MTRKISGYGMALCCVLTLLFISGCMSTGSQSAKTTATGSAGGANAGLEHCDASLGTLAIFEDQSESWYQHLTSDLRLPSTVPVIRLLAQQSNCFVVVERGKAMEQMMQSGEMRSGSNFGKGQIVAADYTATPSITFSSNDTGGAGGVDGGLFGSVTGGVKTSDASTMITLTENRSGVQLAAAEGSARNTDFNLLGGILGHSAGGAVGAYSKTPEGKVIVAAFIDSMNNLIRAVKSYKAQTVKGGLGTGGQLGAQGGRAAMAGQGTFEGVMTQRVYDSSAKIYNYVIITKDKSQTFEFSSPRKILYRDDLIKFQVNNGQVSEKSIILLERRYLQKYWQ